MEAEDALVEWAVAQGVVLNGIKPQRLSGRGVGLIATRAIKPDELLLEVPTSCLRTIETVPKSIARRLPKDMSVHGLLAADLALDTSDRYAAWNAVCPTREELASLPIYWPRALQRLLPEAARKILAKQQSKLERDWKAVSAAFPEDFGLSSSSTASSKNKRENGEDGDASGEEGRPGYEKYKHAWLLVNTRTFYFSSLPSLSRRKRDDRMVLQPVADLFNHSDAGCKVVFDETSFEVRADRAYKRLDEIRICYGGHGGDLLAVEYGFVLDSRKGENKWDEVGLDEVVLPRVSRRWRERLEERGFWGGYVLDERQVCFRTQVAVRTLCKGMKIGEWEGFVEGMDGGEERQEEVDGLLVRMLEEYREKIGEIVEEVEGMEVGEECQRALLVLRWRCVDGLVERTIRRLRVEDGDEDKDEDD